MTASPSLRGLALTVCIGLAGSLGAAATLAHKPAAAPVPTMAQICKASGYAGAAEVHAIGQRIEADFPSGQAITQHNLALDGTPPIGATGDGNYVVTFTCYRGWNAYEQAQANAGLSTKPYHLP